MTPDQIIHEARGLCWHKFINGMAYPAYPAQYECAFCGDYFSDPNPDYSKWEFYGPMVEEMMEKEWWPLFIVKLIYVPGSPVEANDYDQLIPIDMLNPTRGRDAIAEFLKECKNGLENA